MNALHLHSLLTILGITLFPTFWPGESVRASLPAIVTNSDEEAVVYDENGNGQADLFGDTWVYDTNADGRAELILRFRQEPALTAYLYDDANGNGQVDYRVAGQAVEILEPYWRIKIISRRGNWFLPNGRPDWNADLEADSDYAFGWDVNFRLVAGGRGQQDGAPDLLLRYWDVNLDGLPDYEWNNVNNTGPYDAIIVNRNPRLRYRPPHPFPWLETVLEMNWGEARLRRVAHLISSRNNEEGYFIYFNRPGGQSPLPTGWENPFAFYDLAGDQDGFAELAVRLVSEYPVLTSGPLTAYNEVRYSWAQEANRMQYRLYLIGQVFYNGLVPYPFYAVRHVPYESIPSFVRANAWQGAIFGEDEAVNRPIVFDEGIYENMEYTVSLRSRLLSQRAVELPPYIPAYLNLREEYTFTLHDRPRLYFSPVDRRLHLLGAQQGILIFEAPLDPQNRSGFDFTPAELASGQIQPIRHLTYADTDGDRYADTWTLYVYGQPVESLILRRGTALFARGNTLAIKNLPADFGPSLWETTPPATTAEWRALGERLQRDAANRRNLADLAGLFADLPGESTALTGTLLTEISVNSQELIAGITTTGLTATSRPAAFSFFAQAIPPGHYILRGKAGTYWLESPVPSLLALTPIVFLPNDGPVFGGRLLFHAVNHGNQDVTAHLRLTETLTTGEFATIQEMDVRVPAHGQASFDLPWVPAWGGERQVRATLTYAPLPSSAPQTVSTETTLTIPGDESTARTLYLAFPDLLASLLLTLTLLALLIPGVHALGHEEATS